MISFKNKVKFGGGFIIALLLLGGYSFFNSNPAPTNELMVASWGWGHHKNDLIIYVTDKEGVPIENANVTLQQNLWVDTKFTSSSGHSQWKRLKKGHYNLSISKFQYTNISETINHQSNELLEYKLYPFDSLAPEYSHVTINISSPLNWTLDLKINFSARWIDQDSNISKVILHLDYVEYVVIDDISSDYYIVLGNFSIGTHYYFWWCNDSFNNINQTPIYSFEIVNQTIVKEPTLEQLLLLPFLLKEKDDLLYFVIGIGSIMGLVYGSITIGLLIQYAILRNKFLKLKKEKVVKGKYK